ncbi:hypothetical protein Pmani_032194 [Petrolisthes manimaculis]|uniref:Uncharacterized protein n=1 Tax=Petrolisthes manimaculis TaxID=1843537 RepID=A0AAE1NS55_9EUCA|nr:hypothetical protein Pmani_032194 [Petrolisthes manimaculis]
MKVGKPPNTLSTTRHHIPSSSTTTIVQPTMYHPPSPPPPPYPLLYHHYHHIPSSSSSTITTIFQSTIYPPPPLSPYLLFHHHHIPSTYFLHHHYHISSTIFLPPPPSWLTDVEGLVERCIGLRASNTTRLASSSTQPAASPHLTTSIHKPPPATVTSRLVLFLHLIQTYPQPTPNLLPPPYTAKAPSTHIAHFLDFAHTDIQALPISLYSTDSQHIPYQVNSVKTSRNSADTLQTFVTLVQTDTPS